MLRPRRYLLAVALLSTSARADILYVDDDAPPGGDGTSWSTAYRFLQDALTAAGVGAEIRVAQGLYLPDRDESNPGGPPANNCCEPHAGGGCEDSECETLVCEVRPQCCNVSWSYSCTLSAMVLCSGFVCGPETTFQLATGVSILGGFAGLGAPNPDVRDFELYETVLSGDLLNNDDSTKLPFNDNCWNVTTASGVDETAVLGGFTVTAAHGVDIGTNGGGMRNDGGSPTVVNCTFRDNVARRGGGMSNTNGANPTVVDCTFAGNMAEIQFTAIGGGLGGGMYNLDSSPEVTGCLFVGNVAIGSPFGSPSLGGGMANFGASSPTILDCVFLDNQVITGEGSAMSNIGGADVLVIGCTFTGTGRSTDFGTAMVNRSGATAIVIDCDFIANLSPCMRNTSITEVVVAGCTFVGNEAGFGAAMTNTLCSPIVVNCVFAGNIGETGGVIRNRGASPTIGNCTFSGNVAAIDGAVLENLSFADIPSFPTVSNCILWDNGPTPITDSGDSVTTVFFCDVEGGWPGIGNIDADPMFVDPVTWDFRLSSSSPCIDAGNNWGVAQDAADLDADGDMMELTPLDHDGNPRMAGDGNDVDPGCGVPVVVDVGAYEFRGTPFPVVFGDLNGNGTVGLDDLMILTGCLRSSDPGCCIADLDLDGVVGPSDRVVLGSIFAHNAVVTLPPDCNGNGIPDKKDIADGTSADCNGNGAPDDCDLANGTSSDINDNGVPDECDPGPDNDDCANAQWIGEGSFRFSTLVATTDGVAATCQGGGEFSFVQDVWFLFWSPVAGIATFSVCNDADFDTRLAVYSAVGCPPTTPLVCSDNAPGCGETSEVEWALGPGIVYRVRVGGTTGGGTGFLTVSFEPF